VNNLIEILKTGYAYDHTDFDGVVRRTMVAPNKYMIAAAQELVHMHGVLVRLNAAVEQERALNLQLHADCEQYRQTIKALEAKIPATTINEQQNV